MADHDQKHLAIGRDDEPSQETDKCAAASDDSSYVEVDDAIIKDDEFQPLLKSLAPKELDMGNIFSELFGFNGPNHGLLIDAINKSMQTLAPYLESIEYDSDHFLEHNIFGYDNSESLLAYFAPVEDLNYDGILQHIVNGSNHHKRTKDDTCADTYGMVLIGLKLGDVRRDQLKKLASDGAEEIVKLAYWYRIPLRSAPGERVRLQSDTLTFVRAIFCYPHLASLILYQEPAFAKNGASSVLATRQLPEPMKHVGFCGLIPKCCDPYLMKAYVYAHAAYMVDLCKLINPDDKRSLKEMVSSQLEYSKAGVGKILYYDDERVVGYLRTVGLADAGVFKMIVDVCNNVCKVVGEPELDFATAEMNHIKNGMVCFFEDESKDVAAGELGKDVAAGELAKGLVDMNKQSFASKD